MTLQKNPTIEDFARHVAKTNPFVQDRVTQAQGGHADVVAIHDKPFKRLIKRVDEVRSTRSTTGVLLTGPAGVGKSHVLSRLFHWAQGDGKATVVYLHNLLSSPERIGRYLLHAAVTELAGYQPSNFAQSELYKLINLAISARIETSGWRSKGLAPNLALRKEVLNLIGQEIDADQLVMPVFVTYLEQAVGAHLAEDDAEARAIAAVHWLSGDSIDAEVAQRIGLPNNSEDGACIEDDVAVQRVFNVICRLCAQANRPFVLCIDQVDNLSDDQIKALTSFLHAMIDNGNNLVVITSGVKVSLERLKSESIIPTAAYDRVAQHEIQLENISIKDARTIVMKRIDRFCDGFDTVEAVNTARSAESLFPLSEAWWNERTGKLIEMRPRDVVREARDAWQGTQEHLEELGAGRWFMQSGEGGKTIKPDHRRTLPALEERIDQLVALKISEAHNARILNPERLPPDADNLATLTLTLLEACLGESLYTLRKVERTRGRGKVSTYDLWVTEQAPNGELVTNGLTFFTADNALSATNALKRLVGADSPPTHQILVTDKERRPLRPGSKGVEAYDELRRSGRFSHIEITFADHAQLDALSSVLGAARVDDLDVEVEHGSYRPITEAECRASLHRQQMFLQHPLLRELLTEEEQCSPPSRTILEGEFALIQGMIKGELAIGLSMTAREMATIIIQHNGMDQDTFLKVWEKVKQVANRMHQVNQLFVEAVNDDLFLQYAK